MHVEINAQFEFSIDSDKTIPLAMLGEFLTEQDIPARLLEAKELRMTLSILPEILLAIETSQITWTFGNTALR